MPYASGARRYVSNALLAASLGGLLFLTTISCATSRNASEGSSASAGSVRLSVDEALTECCRHYSTVNSYSDKIVTTHRAGTLGGSEPLYVACTQVSSLNMRTIRIAHFANGVCDANEPGIVINYDSVADSADILVEPREHNGVVRVRGLQEALFRLPSIVRPAVELAVYLRSSSRPPPIFLTGAVWSDSPAPEHTSVHRVSVRSPTALGVGYIFIDVATHQVDRFEYASFVTDDGSIVAHAYSSMSP